jgi:hypothetical protein
MVEVRKKMRVNVDTNRFHKSTSRATRLTPLLDGNLRQQLMTANALKLFTALTLGTST